jgi:hypothetical protein
MHAWEKHQPLNMADSRLFVPSVVHGRKWVCAVNTSSSWHAQLIFLSILDMLGYDMWCTCCCSGGLSWPLRVVLLVCNMLKLMVKLTANLEHMAQPKNQLQHML